MTEWSDDNERSEAPPSYESLMEKVIMQARLIELNKIIFMALTARCGGAVTIKHDEFEFCRKNYILTENLNVEDRTVDIRLSVRLK